MPGETPPDREKKRRNKDAWKLPRDKDRAYGPYGQQRPGRRPDPEAEEGELPDRRRGDELD